MLDFKIPECKDVFLNISLALLFGIFSVFMFSSIGFIFGISINKIYLLLSVLIMYLTIFICVKKQNKSILDFLIQSSVLMLILYWAYKISVGVIDSSWDGRTYHVLSTMLLANDWNPIYDNVISSVDNLYGFTPQSVYVWSENYTKAIEIIAANIFLFAQKFESGKMIHFINAFIFYGYTFYVLSNKPFCRINRFLCLFICFLFILNPVVICQIYTLYIDIDMYFYMMLIIMGILDLETSYEKNLPYLVILCSSVLLINTKFGGIFYFIILFLIYFIYLFLHNNFPKIKKLAYVIILTIILGIITGINPYFTNIAKDRHPFYPIAGKEKFDIMQMNTPKDFKDKNYLHQFLLSNISKVNNEFSIGEKVEIKLPFQIFHYEYGFLHEVDIRVNGFGILWSGILLLSLIYALFVLRYQTKEEKSLGMLTFSLILLSTILNPYCWWARYVPQFWTLPLFVIIFSLISKDFNKDKFEYTLVFIALIFVNSYWFISDVNKNMTYYRAYVNKILSPFLNADYEYLIYPSTDDMDLDYAFLQELKERNVKYKIVSYEEYNANKANYKQKNIIIGNQLYYIEKKK